MRNGLFGLGPDAGAADLVAVGLVRLAVEERLGLVEGAPPWLGQLRAASFADAWLAFADPAAPGLRVPAETVLRAVVLRAAELTLRRADGDGPAALERLGRESAGAREWAGLTEVSHPAEPDALVLVWYGVKMAMAGADPVAAAERETLGACILERGRAYVREHCRRQDMLALVLACARSAAATLAELSDGDRDRALAVLDEHAARHMAPTAPVPLWVPGRPGQLAG
ncbi:hypothetical protein ADK60_02795 [Streptomyces sp. XY431]|uniref:hypothetical protein n=1 Tax=Streptomyces sp. XY431 TaxID=1415562 RepID=UPI0006B05961|nr:hypothetical protein [Streptomyces sp. XY431]KOV38168.1 hypothetical protein ADK60_02795 [Streptomyces sp. XY431]